MLLNFLLMNMYDYPLHPLPNCLTLTVRLLTLLKMVDLMLLKRRATYGHMVSAPTLIQTASQLLSSHQRKGGVDISVHWLRESFQS